MKAEREHRAVERELGRKLLRNSYEGNDEDFPEYEKVIIKILFQFSLFSLVTHLHAYISEILQLLDIVNFFLEPWYSQYPSFRVPSFYIGGKYSFPFVSG